MYKHILVATDGSRLSDKAVAAAIGLARLSRARLTAIHVTAPFPMTTYSEYAVFSDAASPRTWNAAQRKRAGRVLDKAQARADKAGVRFAAATEEALNPYEAILATARKKRCDLIVMSSHGRRGLQGLLLGSETHKVLTHGKLPVLVCR